MGKIVVYQKPTCTTCRILLADLEERQVDFESVDYFSDQLRPADIEALLQKLSLHPREVIRTTEPLYRELGIGSREYADAELIALIAEYPELLQRPIVVKDDRAILARPPERIENFL